MDVAAAAAVPSTLPKTVVPKFEDGMIVQSENPSFGQVLGSALDAVSGELAKADALAAAVPSSHTDIAEASIARARADVMLEVAAIAAARVSGAVTQLMQTQL